MKNHQTETRATDKCNHDPTIPLNVIHKIYEHLSDDLEMNKSDVLIYIFIYCLSLSTTRKFSVFC